MTGQGLDVSVSTEAYAEADTEGLARAVRHTLLDQGVYEGEVSLTLLDDEGIQALNRQYLSRDRPTDVIAFNLSTGSAPLGDVYVGVDQARRQSESLGLPLAEELVRLAVHGTLHVLGHDHPEGPERERSPMFRLQERLVSEVRGAPR